MKQPILKRFEYSIPGSGTVAGARHNHPLNILLPLVKVNIDFEKGNLSLEGNDLMIMAAPQKPELIISGSGKRSIKVTATIEAAINIDLANLTTDSFVFSLDGIIDDGESTNSCSGLLVLYSTTNRNGSGGRKWQLTIYVYDDSDSEQTVRLKLTMCSISGDVLLN